ncbi:MAG: DUF5663 domain-containing protein [Candidatus Pacearchaeota archaeon]
MDRVKSIQNLFSSLDLDNLSEQAKNRLLAVSGELITKKVLFRLTQKLAEEQRDKMLVAIRQNDNNAIQEVVENNMDEVEQIIKEESKKIVNKIS